MGLAPAADAQLADPAAGLLLPGRRTRRPPERFAPTELPSSPPLALKLRSGEIRTIIWATGFRPDLSWLDVPVLNRKGQLIHDGGVTAWPGLYLIGMPFLRRRKSSLIDGAAADARDLTAHLVGYLDSLPAPSTELITG